MDGYRPLTFLSKYDFITQTVLQKIKKGGKVQHKLFEETKKVYKDIFARQKKQGLIDRETELDFKKFIKVMDEVFEETGTIVSIANKTWARVPRNKWVRLLFEEANKRGLDKASKKRIVSILETIAKNDVKF